MHIANRIALVDNSTFVLYFQEENLNSTILCRRVEACLDRFLEEKAGLFPTGPSLFVSRVIVLEEYAGSPALERRERG